MTMEELTNILSSRTDSITSKMKKGVVLSIVMNLLLMAGAVNILISFSSDTSSLIVGTVVLVVLIMFSIFSIGQYRNVEGLEAGVEPIRELIIKRINFFKVGYRWVVLSIALSGAFVYLIGSTTYLDLKYGGISLDVQDLIVNGAFLTLALVIGLVANTNQHNRYLNELEICLADLENKVISPSFEEKDLRRSRVYMALAGLGLILLILMVLYLFG